VKKAERQPEGLLQNRTEEDSMNSMNYIGLDIHKKSISCCVRQADGTIMQEGTMPATRDALDNWMKQLPQPWMAGMEATLFNGRRPARAAC
jgi:hypothetical protein